MAFEHYKPTYWDRELLDMNERNTVFAKNTYRKYDNDISESGDVVKISSMVAPTIYHHDGIDWTLEAAETVTSIDANLTIDQVADFNFKMGDIDKKLAMPGVFEDLMKQASLGMSNDADKYIAELAKNPLAKTITTAATTVSADNILDLMDEGQQWLFEKDVPKNQQLYLTCSPHFLRVLRKKWQTLDTDNSELLKQGYLAGYSGIAIDMSNNVATDSNGVEYIMLRTNRAIAYINPMLKTEAYRPEGEFSDALKGFMLYNAKIIRPTELIVLNVKY